MRVVLAAVAAALLAAPPAAAAPELVPLGTYEEPVHVASPPNDPRVFVVEKGGRVQIAGGGTFLDASALTESAGERGLLSVAFPRDYGVSGRFYVFLTTPGMPYDLRVVEFRRSSDPDRADPRSARVVVSVPHEGPYGNHNGGQIQFGPDGALYMATGDGGGGGDPFDNGQDVGSELGKLLRVNARTGRAARGNPFGSRVWAYGLRNPWRFSFDRATGELWVGDVGQGEWEEINGRPPGRGRGANFGWSCFEGAHTYRQNCSAPGALAPTLEHSHRGFCSITGGYVVRDPGLPSLLGRYLYGDLCHPVLRSVGLTGDGDRAEPVSLSQVVSLGEDACGRIHVVSLRGGVHRLQDGAATPCRYTDYRPPRLRAKVRRPVRRRVAVAVRCNERCRVKVRARGVGSRRRSLPAGKRRVLRLAIGRRAAVRLRRARRVVVRVSAVDRAGNGAARTLRVRVARRLLVVR